MTLNDFLSRKLKFGLTLCLLLSGCVSPSEKPAVQEKSRNIAYNISPPRGLEGLPSFDYREEEKQKLLVEARKAVNIFKESPSNETLKVAEEKFYDFFEICPHHNSIGLEAALLFYADRSFHQKLISELSDKIKYDRTNEFTRGKLHNHLATLILHSAFPPTKEDSEIISSWENYRVQVPERVEKFLVKRAEAHYSAAIDLLQPGSKDADSVSIFGLGMMYERAGMNEEAISVLSEAVEREEISQRSDIHYRLGKLSEKIGKRENAIESYQRAIESDSKSEFTKFGIWSYVRLGEAYLAEGNIEEANRNFNELISLYWKEDRIDGEQFSEGIELFTKGAARKN